MSQRAWQVTGYVCRLSGENAAVFHCVWLGLCPPKCCPGTCRALDSFIPIFSLLSGYPVVVIFF